MRPEDRSQTDPGLRATQRRKPAEPRLTLNCSRSLNSLYDNLKFKLGWSVLHLHVNPHGVAPNCSRSLNSLRVRLGLAVNWVTKFAFIFQRHIGRT
jgi:hypothetical protein